MTHSTSVPGIIGNRYEVLNQLGEGGMAVVYRARDIQTDTLVAIKALKPELVESDSELVERFTREAIVLRQLNHPNIVKVYATLLEDERHYIVMEYVAGGTLAALLHREEKLPLQRALSIALELADALTRAHFLEVIHRDVKPSNVLITPDGKSLLTDFGVAYLPTTTRLTESGVAVGTVDYLPPEALSGLPVDERADIWAFGVMLYEMLVGQRPFEGENVGATVTAILYNPAPDIRTVNPEIPEMLANLIDQMLRKNVAVRLSSIRKAGVEIEAVLAGRVPNIETSSRFETPTKSTRPFTAPTIAIEDWDDPFATTIYPDAEAPTDSYRMRRPALWVVVTFIVGLGMLSVGLWIIGASAFAPPVTPTPLPTATPTARPTLPVFDGSNIPKTPLADGQIAYVMEHFRLIVPAEWPVWSPEVLALLKDDETEEIAISLSKIENASLDFAALSLLPGQGVIVLREELPSPITMNFLELRMQATIDEFTDVAVQDRVETPAGEMLHVEGVFHTPILVFTHNIQYYLLDGTAVYWIIFLSQENNFDDLHIEARRVIDSFTLLE